MAGVGRFGAVSCGTARTVSRCTLATCGGPTAAGVGEYVQPGGPKTSRGARVSGRPPFGLGPIARVSSAPAPDAEPDMPGMPGTASGPPAAPDRFAAFQPTRPPDHRYGFPVGGGPDPARTRAFGLPNLRRNVCPHFYVTGTRGALPIHAPHLLKGIVRQDSVVSRCQLRGGVHLEQSYVNDVCLSPRFNQCVFYEEELSGR